ncbi:MAG: hypothetical protein IT367_12120 [Candidatus Hydrogenedentes bacterium]|nr:hypothetical protein [Candidatus Hydrogenedentota bacterium]
MIRRISGAAVLIAFALCSHAEGTKPQLAISKNRFTVDGQERFLVFVSYFDAMRASAENLETDFTYLREHGVDGIRIFPNWWDFRSKIAFARDTLMDGKGNPRPERMQVLKDVLDRADRHAMIVDVSFAYETVEGLSDLNAEQIGTGQGALPVNQVHIDDYERGLIATAMALTPYENLFFDVQNEYNGRITHLSDDEVRRLGAAIKHADPMRLVTASLANEIGPEEVSERSNKVEVDIVGWHESRNPWRFDIMDQLVLRAIGKTSKPIYLGEPALLKDELTVENFVTAITKAKAGGAAAWCLHTQNGFDLSTQPLVDRLTGGEKEFLSTFKKSLDATAWGTSTAAK